jgi:hypothetical protein
MMAFPTINQKDWDTSGFDKDVKVGDLVSLCSAPASKWYVSWVREIETENGWTRYLLESIDDGTLCWWSNVGLNIYSRERVKERPTWQWDDKQFAFNDRWHKVGKRNNAHIVLPCQSKFNDDGSVELDVRIRYGWDEYHNPRIFPNWQKLLMKDMDIYYKECVQGYEKNLKKIAKED